MKKLIWITGSMSSGKSTLRRNLISVLVDFDGEVQRGVFNGYNFLNTSYKNILGVVGEVTSTSQCDGLDRSFSYIGGKVQSISSTEKCIQDHDITILESSITSKQWVEPLIEVCKRNKCEFILVHLKLPYYHNILRLKGRLESKGGTVDDVTDKRIESIITKNRQFNTCYEYCEPIDFIKKVQIDVTNLHELDTLEECVKKCGLYEM